MTGIDRLRGYAANLKGTDRHYAVGADVEAIADQIERETLPRPLFDDGEPVGFGDEFYVDGWACNVEWVSIHDDGMFILKGNHMSAAFQSGERVKRQAPKVFDANGVPFYDGDIVYGEDGTEYKVVGKMLATRKVFVEKVDGWSSWLEAGKLTHKKPEPPDSWERIEDDAKKVVCEYFDSKWMHCDDCKADIEDCTSAMSLDVFRRCRALAEKEAGR